MSGGLSQLVCDPIGIVHSPYVDRVSAPRQSGIASEVPATIELFAGRGFEFAVEDLEGWQYLWVVFWFHLNQGWRPKVLPPRSTRRRGVFATRSPHRPNPIGLSAVELVSIDGLSIRVRGADLVDGTPVLDLKPYVAYTDAIPHARAGWLDEAALSARPDRAAQDSTTAPPESGGGTGAPALPVRAGDPLKRYTVAFSDVARAQLDWLRERGVELELPLVSVLQLGPQPHPYRRIRPEPGGFQIAMHEWRAHFAVDQDQVRIANITTGYKARQLALESRPELDAHRDFVRAFGAPSAVNGRP